MPRPRFLRCLALAALCAALVACDTAGPIAPTPAGPVDATGDWLLETGTVDGVAIPIVADFPITFSVKGAEVGGTAACNGYGARLEVADGQVRLGQLGATAMLCGEPDGVMRSEELFIRALEQVRAARREADRLTLLGQTAELVFKLQAPLPVADIVGTDWILESVIDGDVETAAIGDPALLRLDEDGTFHGSTGCRPFTGTWIQAAGRLAATQINAEGECPGGLGGQDGAVVEGLDGALPTIDGDRLTLTMQGGLQLIYRRAAE